MTSARAEITGSPQETRCEKPASPSPPEGSGDARLAFRRLPLATEKKLGGGAHHLRGPHGLEAELGVDGFYTLDGEGLRFDLFLDHVPHRAHRAREAERHVHVAPLVVDAHVVDQAKLYEIHPDLRVDNVPQLIPYPLLSKHFSPLVLLYATRAPFPYCNLATPLFHQTLPRRIAQNC